MPAAPAEPRTPEIEDANLPAADLAAIRNVILDQIAAFRDDDAARAFSFSAPSIRQMFGTADVFLQMVRKSYPAVYRPRSHAFRTMQLIEGKIVQPLAVIGPSGVAETALYVMQRQPDGSWKIEACIMAEEPGRDT